MANDLISHDLISYKASIKTHKKGVQRASGPMNIQGCGNGGVQEVSQEALKS